MTGGPGGVAVFVNPRSRANRRDPGLAAAFAAVLGDQGRVLAPGSLDELQQMALALRDEAPAVVAVHGGDGTLHKVVTALGAAWGERPLPPLAVLAGGTMNVVATSLGIADKPLAVLRSLAADARAARPLDLIPRRCLRLQHERGGDAQGGDRELGADKLGFVFGNGLSANFLGAYYAGESYGPGRAVWLLARTICSSLVGGPFGRRIFKRFEGQVRVDGATLPRTRFVGVSAATVREVGLGFKLNHRADDDPERFGVLAIHAPPLSLLRDFPAVHAGRGIAAARAFSAVASTLEIACVTLPSGHKDEETLREMSYTIDGDLYHVPAGIRLRISVGPRILFVRPRSLAALALPARGPDPTRKVYAPELLSAPAGDTMVSAR